MAFSLTDLDTLCDLPFDEVIDVRSPSEFAEDHVPGALNLPVLDDDERARVGTIYTQDSPFEARKIGAALVARNAARHIEHTLMDRPKSWRPLVYCWRGGQRSGSFTTILHQIGWRAEVIEGGYRRYRRLVQDALYQSAWPSPVVILDGNTGTAKTDLLPLVAAAGMQVLDLEGLANHRGSLFGAMPGGQPAQKMFETRLVMAMRALDPSRPVLVEGESSKIGQINLPPMLWEAMKSAPRVTLTAPLRARAAYLARRYDDVIADAGRLSGTIRALRSLHPSDRITAWLDMATHGAHVDLAEALMRHHYDPRYEKQRTRFDDLPQEEVALDGLSPAELDAAAPRIAAAAQRLSAGRSGAAPR